MQATTQSSDMRQLVTFKLVGQKYAVDILKVQEIVSMKEITAIPNSPPYLSGAINLRGRVIPVLSLRAKFGLARSETTDQEKIVIMDVKGIIMGVIVDAVSDVLRITSDVVEPPPRVSMHSGSEVINGIAKLPEGLVIILDMDKLLIYEEHATILETAKAAA